MTKVKICGITNEEDALKASILGADYLGFLVEIGFSEDKVTRERAKEIIKKLPLEVTPVFVTYLQKAQPIIEIAKEINPQVIQLHNDITIEEVGKIRKSLPKIKLTKTISVVDEDSIQEAKKYEKYIDFILLDTKSGKKKGGTGKVHNWDISRKIVKSVNKKVFLAGGLNPDNVSEAIKKVKPYAVDTNSGVKAKAKKKLLKSKISNGLEMSEKKNFSEHTPKSKISDESKVFQKDYKKLELFISRAKR